jgi:hypothetical protein
MIHDFGGLLYAENCQLRVLLQNQKGPGSRVLHLFHPLTVDIRVITFSPLHVENRLS